jgi:hypothetical protein
LDIFYGFKLHRDGKTRIHWRRLHKACIQVGGEKNSWYENFFKILTSCQDFDERGSSSYLPGAEDNTDHLLSLRKTTFSWQDVCYTVSVGGKEKHRQLLDNISGWITPGKMTALMGYVLFFFGDAEY